MAQSFKNFINDTKADSDYTAAADHAALFPAAPDNGFTVCSDGRYAVYTQYSDDKYSSISEIKDILLDSSQINITQETNSQYIPFKIPRYWDGMDLMDMFIQIHYQNKSNKGNLSNAVNVSYSNDSIAFGWLVDEHVTAIAGEVVFELMATGVNEKGEKYVWKTKPTGKLTVLQALNFDGIIEPADEWYTSFVTLVLGYVSEAKAHADEAKASADSVDTGTIVSTVKETLTPVIAGQLTEALSGYYDRAYTDSLVEDINTAIGNINSLSNLNITYDNTTGSLVFRDGESELAKIVINSLANLNVTYTVVNGKGSLTFLNGESEISAVELSEVEPSAAWTAALRLSVTGEITDAVNGIETEIKNVKTAAEDLDKKVVPLIEDVKTAETDIVKLKSDVTSVSLKTTELENAVTVVQNDVDGYASDILDINTAVASLEKKIDEATPSGEYRYRLSYSDDSYLSLLENGEAVDRFKIAGGGQGGGATSTVTIGRTGADSSVILLGNQALIEYTFSSVDNVGDSTGDGTAAWKVGNTAVAASAAIQGKNTFDITPYLKTGSNNIRLSITDSFGTIGTKTWTVTVIEFRLESNFDDSLFYSGEVTFRYTPYGDISKQIVFLLDGKNIGSVTTPVTGRQMTRTIPVQSHGSHLLEVYMTADVNNREVMSESVYKDIIWVEAENTTPIIGCAVHSFTAQQYSATSLPYVVYDPSGAPAAITLAIDGKPASTLSVGRTRQIWSYKSSSVGKQELTITCGSVTKTITAVIEELGIEIHPVTTNLAFDFNPSGRNNAEDDWLKINDTMSISVSSNFDTSNGGYQIDGDGDTYFCVKAGTTATIPYRLFADDAKKTGKNFKFIYKTANVRDYEAQVLSCYSNGIGFRTFAQDAVLTSEQNRINVPYCEDNYMELEFNILPDSEYTEMVLWLDSIPSRVKLYSASDSFTQTAPVGITIGSEDCDVLVYRMKSYTMNLTDDEILDNFIADAKNSDEMIGRYIRNNILDSSGGLDPDLLAEKCPDLRIIKIDTPRFTTGKKDKVKSTSFQQIYVNGRDRDNWISANGIHSGQGTSSEYYGESGRNLDLNCSGGFTFADGTEAEKYDMTEDSVPVNYFNIKVNIASSENKNNDGCAEEYNTFNPYLRPARINNPKVRDTMEFHQCVIFIRETDVENAVEFRDGQWHFYACGNIGNSKKNSEAMGMNPDNHKEFIVEISNNTDPQCRFLSDDLSNEGWDGDTSFEMRYENPDCTEEELQAGKDAWQALLTWVANATPETFAAEFEEHFIKDSVLFYYLFTERYTLVDNRAKNTFWHTEDLIHWDLCFDYDNDTAMGNDNVGGLTLSYGYEDTDLIGTKSVFNASDSKVFCYVRDYMQADLAAMFIKLESQLAWSANRILAKFENEQAMKPERLWIMDMRRKYFRPYEENGTISYLDMMHGDKKHQRRQFQKYQEKYISSKYVGAACTSDVITIRGYTPANWSGVKPDGTFHIVPYADTYVVNRFGSNLIKTRAKRGQTYEMKSPVAAMNDTEVYVYNASLIQSIGDIAPFYPGYTDFNQGIKLTGLTVGSGVEGYQNTNMNDFGIGRNTLLERLDLRNLPNLKKTVSLAECVNLTEFLADGSGITGIIFADGGKITTAHLPAPSSLTAANLYYLSDLSLESYENITTLSLENCPAIDEKEILNKAVNLSRLRLMGIDWKLEHTGLLDRLAKLAGIDENGYNTAASALGGKVYVPVMRQQKLEYYHTLWPDLDIRYDTMITQYKVTFQNDDANHTILDVQYVDKGGNAADPVDREDNPIPVPQKASTVSADFTFTGWDESLAGIFGDRTITAAYSETIREYTVRYVSKGLTLQEKKAPYGTTVFYTGDLPSYTAEEAAYKYHLFNRWDKSGLVDGDKQINAVYDTCEYTAGYFDGKELKDMSEVELYALLKLGMETELLTVKDSLGLKLGNDYSFDDIEEYEVIASDMKFDGTNYFDTELPMLNGDRDFTIAIDFEFSGGNSAGATLAQCFQSDGSNGFRLWWSTEPKLSWGTDSDKPSTGANREMVVLRHAAGSNNLSVYKSNLSGNEVINASLTAVRNPVIPSTLVFGCSKADDGAFENHAKGIVHWCKIWYADLGEDMGRNIAQWIHETVPMDLAKFKGYYLADTSSKRASVTFLASRLLGAKKQFNNKSTNDGGWAAASLNTWLNTRLYNALSPAWKALIKPVKVYSSIGLKSNETSVSSCYFYIPSLYELDNSAAGEPYINETNATIPYLVNDEARKRSRTAAPEVYEMYWTRSPNIGFTNYIHTIDETGANSGYSYPSYDGGILLMFSIGI